MVPAEPGDVVEREDAPEMAEGGAGGAIFGDRGQHLGERMLALRAGYIWHTNTLVPIGTIGANIAWPM